MASISQPGVVDKEAEDTVDNPPPPLGNRGQSAGGSMNKVSSTCSMNRSVSDMKKRTSTFTMKKADEESRMSGDEKDRAARCAVHLSSSCLLRERLVSASSPRA